MAIRIKFDSDYNAQNPTFVLATRKGHKLGSIPAQNIVFKRCLNSYSEIFFKVYKNLNGVEYKQWDKLKDFKLLWCREWDLWFEIYVEIDETNELVKNVIAKSLGEAELSQINLYNIEINTEDDIAREDYDEPTVFYNKLNPKASLLHRIAEKIPHYTFGTISLSLLNIQRTFSFDNISIYDALQEIAKEIDCIFIIECSTDSNGYITRKINAFDLKSYCSNADCYERGDFLDACPKCGNKNIYKGYGEDTTISVSTENLADGITYSTDTGAVKNCFRLVAGDDLMTATIANCNPNGSGYIWYISDEVKSDMSNDLVSKIEEYDRKYEYYQNDHIFNPNLTILNNYNELIAKYKAYNEDEITFPQGVDAINSSIKGYPNLMNAHYNTIDFNLFLNNGLMPTINALATSASAEAIKLNSSSLSPVAVMNLDYVSEATATSSVLAMAKVIVDPRYQVRVNENESSFSNPIWTGSFIITNYSDENDVAVSNVISIRMTDNYENFVKQKIDKVLNKKTEEIADIVTLFNTDDNTFISELKKYSLSRLISFYDACQSCLDILIEQGVANSDSDLYEMYLSYYHKLGYIADETKVRENEIKVVTGLYDSDGFLIEDGMQSLIENERDKIQKALNFEFFLGESLWLEFSAYRREDICRNDNYISDGLDNAQLFENALEFIERAKENIYKSATLQHSITARLKNLLVMKEFKPIVDYFEVGNWIRLKIDDKVYRLRLIDYKINFDDLKNIEITFSDVMTSMDGVSDVESVLNQASSMASSYGSVSHQASQGDKGNKQLENWVSKGLALTKMKIIDDADSQNITWDSHGLLCKEYLPITDTYDDRQLKIINRGLYLTDDNWLTSKVGIGNFAYYNPMTQETEEAYGVIADTLVGNLILSESVGIYNTENSITLDKKGLTITTDGTEDGINDIAFTIRKKTGKGKDDYEELLWVDESGTLNISDSVIIGGSGDESINAAIQAELDRIDLLIEGVNEVAGKASNEANEAKEAAEDAYTNANDDMVNALRSLADLCFAEGYIVADNGVFAAGTITANNITAGSLKGTFGTLNLDEGTADWIGSFTTRNNNGYQIKLDGYSMNLFSNNSKDSAAISFCTTPSSWDTYGSDADLAIAGANNIYFGFRPKINGVPTWTPLCKINKTSSNFSLEPCVSGALLGADAEGHKRWYGLNVENIDCNDNLVVSSKNSSDNNVVNIIYNKIQACKDVSDDSSRVELNSDDSKGCSVWFKNGNKYGAMLLNSSGDMEFSVPIRSKNAILDKLTISSQGVLPFKYYSNNTAISDHDIYTSLNRGMGSTETIKLIGDNRITNQLNGYVFVWRYNNGTATYDSEVNHSFVSKISLLVGGGQVCVPIACSDGSSATKVLFLTDDGTNTTVRGDDANKNSKNGSWVLSYVLGV